MGERPGVVRVHHREPVAGIDPRYDPALPIPSRLKDPIPEGDKVAEEIVNEDLKGVVAGDPVKGGLLLGGGLRRELPGEWVEFSCRWEAKRSTYLKVVEGEYSQQIMQAEGRLFCLEPLEFEAQIKLVINGEDSPIYEVVKVDPKTGLEGEELYRVLLLGGVGA